MSSSVGNKCSVCSRTFARQEHLTRHARSHTKEKPFNCVDCGKNYSRLDILSRHQSQCHGSSPREASPKVSSRACRQCATGRVRCSKSYPCARCAEKKLQCNYPGNAKLSPLPSRDSVADEAHLGHFDAVDIPNNAGRARIAVSIQQGMSLVPENLVNARQPQPALVDMETGQNVTHDLHGNDTWLTMGNEEPIDRPSLQDVVIFDQQNINRFYDFDTGQHFDQHPLADLSTNWLSPPYDAMLDWNNQLRIGPSYDNMRSFVFPFSTKATEIAPESDVLWEAGNSRTDPLSLPFSETRSPRNRANPPEAHLSEELIIEPDEVASAQSGITPAASALGDGEYYVGGTGARAPFRGKHLQTRSALSDVAHHSTSERAATTDHAPSQAHADGPDFTPTIVVSEETYNDMLRGIRDGTDHHSQNLSELPSMAHVHALVQLYFTKFHPIFPFVMKDAFRFNVDSNGILLLAVSVIGTKYAQTVQAAEMGKRLLVVLRRLLRQAYDFVSEDEEDAQTPLTQASNKQLTLPVLQAGILNLICMVHSGEGLLTRRALAERYTILEACRAMDLLRPGNVTKDVNEADPDGTGTKDWLKRQCEIRTGMMIWLLDSVISYESGCKPLMSLTDAQAPLPCPEEVLDTGINVERISKAFEPVTLIEAVEMLYIEKRLPPDLSEFSTLLLVHAIYRRTKEVISHIRTHLSSWNPSRKTQPRPQSTLADESWPPATPILSSWRNSACDCLDILHWRANSKIAQAAGWEHPTVLYLHLARLVLLTPTDHLQRLATMSADTRNIDGDRYGKARDHVLQWAIRDQFKSRLSIVHAGALLWHVRRFSSNGFIEPFAIYIATLVVWAYSVSFQFASQHQDLHRFSHTSSSAANPSVADVELTSPTDSNDEPVPDPAVIYLDRPCDDEMVQSYVRQGHKMTGCMLRVSNICAPDAPKKILQEGLRLLSGRTEHGVDPSRQECGRTQDQKQDVWGIEHTYAESLRSLL